MTSIDTSPLATKLCQDLQLEFPVVAFSHCRDVVAAVSNVGGLGILGAVRFTADELELELRWLDEHAVRYGVDVLLPSSKVGLSLAEHAAAIPEEHKAFVRQLQEEAGVDMGPDAAPAYKPGFRDSLVSGPAEAKAQIDVVLRHDVAAVAFGLGSSHELLAILHERGVKVFGLVGTRPAGGFMFCGGAARAPPPRRVADLGVDYIVATGHDAGGHTGEIGTFSLVPQVVDAVAPVPVLAAGGVASGRQLVAALALGAVGVWMGTMWLVSAESEVDPIVKQKLIAAQVSDAVKTRAFSGKPSRRLRSGWSQAWARQDAPEPLGYFQQGLLVRDTVYRIADQHIEEYMDTPAGQGIGLVRQAKPCKDMLMDLIEEAADTLGSLEVSS
jgi:NAD(P)H-dependent flavin oxidoreductase YrpB (nitropropane dioxygenase family)